MFLPHWPRCRKYSTLVYHGLPSSQSSTSPTQVSAGETLVYDLMFDRYKIITIKIKSFAKENVLREGKKGVQTEKVSLSCQEKKENLVNV